MDGFDYDDKEKNALIEAIYFGIVTLQSLPKKLYDQTAKTLKKSLYTGYGGTLLDFKSDSPDYKLLSELRENIYIFSGAKTATQVHEIKSLMYDGNKILSLPEFKKLALPKFEAYNGKASYLESEYITAHTTASSAKNFRYTLSNKDLFPTMTAVVIMDQYTAPECARMAGVTAPVDHPIWKHNIAARHFRCRCHEERNDKYDKISSTPAKELSGIMAANEKDMSDIFKMNPVYDKIIFSNKHPYYDIGKRYKSLSRKNWNLPIPKSDEK